MAIGSYSTVIYVPGQDGICIQIKLPFWSLVVNKQGQWTMKTAIKTFLTTMEFFKNSGWKNR